MFNFRFINIIENRECKQKIRNRERKRERQLKLDIEQERIEKRCCKRRTTSNIDTRYSRDKFKT